MLEPGTVGRAHSGPLRTHAAKSFCVPERIAGLMAYDLASTPVAGIDVQACGDCHLGNFGLFATPDEACYPAYLAEQE